MRLPRTAVRCTRPDDVALQVFRQEVEARVAEYEEFEPEPLDVPGRCGLN